MRIEQRTTRAFCGFAFIVCALALAACAPTLTTSVGTSIPFPPAKATAIAGATETAVALPTATPQPSSPACASGQLAGRVWVGGVGAGNVLGGVSIRNISFTPCSVQGTVTLTALDAHGQPIPGIAMAQPTTLAYATLPPNTPATPPSGSSAAGKYVEVGLMGEYRDDPKTGGLCGAADEVTPARFVVTLGTVSIQATNNDPASLSFKAIKGCRGQISGQGASLSQ